MPRGGRRPGSGPKSSWNYGPTTTIRVPIALAARLLEIARCMDDGDPLPTRAVIDLSGVSVRHSPQGPVIRLVDLLGAGYEIKPERLLKTLKTPQNIDFSLEALLLEAEQKYE
jgi:hypothetical protein